MPRIRVSLANKCQILFGAAVLLILSAALFVPWLRMQKLVAESQREIARELADAWLADLIQLAGAIESTPEPLIGDPKTPPRRLRLISETEFAAESEAHPFIAEALDEFETPAGPSDLVRVTRAPDGQRVYHYVRAVRRSDIERARGGGASTLVATQVADPLQALLVIEMQAGWAGRQLLLNTVYTIIAGLLAVLLAIAVFWFITTRLILSPVRVLRETAEKVAEGDLNIRSDINTGDEFEQLSDTFNDMLASLKGSQDKLRDLNKQLDLKLGELAESNLTLYEANRIKGDFLANVSHELRTPLNSIIGFAEVLSESLASMKVQGNDKRLRYVENILTSSRSLLTMITELLDLAKIEAGRIDLNVDTMSVTDTCEVLLNLIRPQADAKQLQLSLNLARGLPVVSTDPGKFQQIIFNFLSNAVKFTPKGGRIELGAATTQGRDDSEPTGLRVWVKDTGPGIPVEKHEEIFEKFRQLDSSHTKEHGGTGLGLAISKELARLLEGRIDLESDVGRGATFILWIPLDLAEKSEPLMPDLAD
jgi:signal transduction histidine kinase